MVQYGGDLENELVAFPRRLKLFACDEEADPPPGDASRRPQSDGERAGGNQLVYGRAPRARAGEVDEVEITRPGCV